MYNLDWSMQISFFELLNHMSQLTYQNELSASKVSYKVLLF